MSNKTYDILAYIQRIILPAVATLIATLGQIWGWEFPVEQIVLTLTAVDTFMGVVLRISSTQYFSSVADINAELEDEESEETEGGIG